MKTNISEWSEKSLMPVMEVKPLFDIGMFIPINPKMK
jgi:hypothetical protein